MLIETAQAVRHLAVEAGRVAADRVLPVNGTPPARARDVTPTWLGQALGRRVSGVRIVDEHHGTASRARLAVDYPEGVDGPATVFLKLSPDTFGGRLFMNVMGIGEREVRFYEQLAPDVGPIAPTAWATAWDAARGRSVIVLEDLAARGCTFADITESCSPDRAAAVVQMLASLHARFWGSTPAFLQTPRAAAPAVLGGALLKRAIRTTPKAAADLVPDHVRRRSEVLLDRQVPIGVLWHRLSTTVTHGDTHVGNLFFDGERPGLLDWQNVSIGPAIHDVAYFVMPSMTIDDRRKHERALVDTYRAALRAAGGPDLDAGTTWDHYRAAGTRYYVGAVITAMFGDRLQRLPIVRAGVERAVAAVDDLDGFETVTRLSEET